MQKKKKLSANEAAEELAKIALRRLKTFSEEEQEKRLAAAERLLAERNTAEIPKRK